MNDERAIPQDPHDWLPMRPYRGKRVFEITDPIVEPLWSGVRVLAHVKAAAAPGTPATVSLIEVLGADLAPELPDLAAAIASSTDADDAVLDGVISRQVGLDGVGAVAVPEVRTSTGGILTRNKADLDVAPPTRSDEDEDVPEGFIAFDLLRLDGSELFDVPLLERKRLLESVVHQSQLVRVSIHVRPPIDTWVATWKSLGLRGGMLKAANSRYRPGDDSIEWRPVENLGRRR